MDSSVCIGIDVSQDWLDLALTQPDNPSASRPLPPACIPSSSTVVMLSPA